MAIPVATFPTTPQMARSPIFITLTKGAGGTDGLINATLTLRIFTGDRTTSPAIDYTLFKESVSDAPITFEISELIREKIASVLKTSTTNTYELSTTEGVWCKFSLSSEYVDAGTPGSGIIQNNQSFLVTDGWLTYQEVSGSTVTTGRMVTPRRLYITGVDYAMPIYLPARMYFFYRNVGGSWQGVANYTPGNNSNTRIVYIPYDKTKAQAFLVAASSAVVLNDTFEVGFGTDAVTPQFTYTVEQVCEPKYTPVRISFINKFGVVDYLTCFKVSTRSGSFTAEQYMPQINISATTPQSLTQTMQKRRFDVNSTEVITLNTGWVQENYDDVIRELLMSEKVSINYEGVEFTVNPQDSGVDYQKEINQKMINYTLSFEIAWDIRNNIR
jgi:hypothetical protein